jgi:hypothetical protein
VAFVNSGGVLRISRDVVVKEATAEEFVAISLEPAVAGDVLTIAVAAKEAGDTESVRVIASRPFVRNGGVVHELRLARLATTRAGRQS